MSCNVSVFELRIETRGDKVIRWHPWKDGEEYDKKRIMLHYERRTAQQAMRVASKKGKVLSCRELSRAEVIEREADRIDSLPLDNALYMNVNPYSNAVAMDEMIWKKRNNRRDNIQKDKENY